MGSIYCEKVLGVKSPRVGLLSIGEEDIKGNELTRAAFRMLNEAPIEFVGNVEGRDIGLGSVDVVVCDGFVGNIVLKVAEGFAQCFACLLKGELRKERWWGRLGMALLARAFARFRKRMDYSEYGGAVLLGVNGVCIITHGSSNARGICCAIEVAQQCIADGVVEHVKAALEQTQRAQLNVS